jgi:SAM-dependent methyltransferase
MSSTWRAALAGEMIATYRQVLALPHAADVRDAVLDDLSTYYGFDLDECLRRCINWESWSVEEWHSQDRSSVEGVRAFYNSTQSWSFDLLWYAYLQAEGAVYPTTIASVEQIESVLGYGRCLDFGSGIGDAAQLLLSLGFTVDLADVSETLQSFARWRLDRRGQQAEYIDLNTAILPTDTYDVVLAKDVLAHVPDFARTVAALHRSLRPNGLLIANFDTRPQSPENAWHLYDDDLPLRRTLQSIGFDPVSSIDGFIFIYRRVDPRAAAHVVRRARDSVLLGPPRHIYRRGRALLRRLADRW